METHRRDSRFRLVDKSFLYLSPSDQRKPAAIDGL
jgi:hypothetical protein